MSEAQSPGNEWHPVDLDLGRHMELILSYTGKICSFCYLEITPAQLDDPDTIYREVASWVTGPKLQSPVLRSQTGRIAHADCVKKMVEGQAPDQDRIPGLEIESD